MTHYYRCTNCEILFWPIVVPMFFLGLFLFCVKESKKSQFVTRHFHLLNFNNLNVHVPSVISAESHPPKKRGRERKTAFSSKSAQHAASQMNIPNALFRINKQTNKQMLTSSVLWWHMANKTKLKNKNKSGEWQMCFSSTLMVTSCLAKLSPVIMMMVIFSDCLQSAQKKIDVYAQTCCYLTMVNKWFDWEPL